MLLKYELYYLDLFVRKGIPKYAVHFCFLVYIYDVKNSYFQWGSQGGLRAKYHAIICGNKMPTRSNRWFLLQILLLAQHVSGTSMPIIRSSRVLYRWLLPVVFGDLVFKLLVLCRAEGYMSGLLQPAKRTHNPQLHTTPTTWKPKHQIPQAAATCIILSSSWWWAQWCPKHVEQAINLQ